MTEQIQNGIPSIELYKEPFSSFNNNNNNIKKNIEKQINKEDRNRSVEVSSLQDLIAKLHEEFAKDVVDIDYICQIMTNFKSVPQEWKKYAKFDRYRYTRNLVDAGNDKFNLMILCWGEGHGSAIHDHAKAHCFMKVMDGTLSEVKFAFPKSDGSSLDQMEEIGRTDLKTNEVCYINDTIGLHRVENPSHVNTAVSLHLYCPPFDSCSVFNQQTGQRTKCKVTFWSKFGERSGAQEERAPEDN